MKLSFDEIFKYSEIFNPISPNTLLLAGKLAKLEPLQKILDLGSGKGTPSLLWASLFGVQIEGYDLGKEFVEYANLRAKMLNLSHRVKYYSKDIKKLSYKRKYDVVASLGLGIAQIYGNINDGLKNLKAMLNINGFLIFAEPLWLKKNIQPEILEKLGLGADKEYFLTQSELRKLIERLGLQVKGCFISTKKDWELYIKPVNLAMNEIIENKGELAEEAKMVLNSFKNEYDAVDQYWNMALWVLKA